MDLKYVQVTITHPDGEYHKVLTVVKGELSEAKQNPDYLNRCLRHVNLFGTKKADKFRISEILHLKTL